MLNYNNSMNSLTILTLVLFTQHITADCLSKEALINLNFTPSSSLQQYPDTSPEYCTDIWKENGSCVKGETWSTQIDENFGKPAKEPNDKFPNADSPELNEIDTQQVACHNANSLVFNKYICLLTSGQGSSNATFTPDHLIETINIEDVDVNAIYL